MEIFDEEPFDQGLVFLKGIENGFQLLGFERGTGQLRELSQGDNGEFFDEFANCLLYTSDAADD